jgi:hypothetical protein
VIKGEHMKQDPRLTCIRKQYSILHREILRYKLIAQSRRLSFEEVYYLQMLEEDFRIAQSLLSGNEGERPRLFALESQRPLSTSRA